MEQPVKNTPNRSSSFGIWLSWLELNGRKTVFFINVILIALLIALPVSLDLMGKARRSSVETRLDYIGPSLILAPKGIMSSDLVTAQLKDKTFKSSIFNEIHQRFSRLIRYAEPRLTTRIIVDSRSMPVAGIDFNNVHSHPFDQYSISGSNVLLGNVTSEKLQKSRRDTLRINSREFVIAGVIPTTGGIDDVSVFLPLSILQKLTGQEGLINEIRIFPESVSAYEQLKSRLEEHSGDLDVIDTYRGDTAEQGIETALNNYQSALYIAAFILIALCIMISSYINLDGRKAEVSAVYTLGATQGIIFQILIFRTIWITLLGSLIGQLIAIFITALQNHQIPLRFIWSLGPFIEVVLYTVCLGMLVTIPFALYSVYRRDLVAHM